ncbi:Peroxisomal sarcosine oxidase [Aphelenchoides bicaudatus]|nr:Peroxisomal sarcosine oxidase [Aphelenchoides bicaudatus]
MLLLLEPEVMGLSTAYRLSKRGKKVCVLEQSNSPSNLLGASHGESRIIRLIHTDDVYVPMAIESYRLWRGLEHETGTKLYENHGMLWLGDKEGSLERAGILARYNAPHELLNNQQINERYKHLNYDSKWYGVLDHTGGTIFARKCLEALKKASESQGVTFHYGQRMSSWESTGSKVKVVTSAQTFYAKTLVLAVGGWLENTVKNLPVKVQPVAVPVYFWDIADKSGGQCFDLDKRSPNLIISDVWNDQEVFMIPNADYKGKVKFGVHTGEPFVIDSERPTNLIAVNRKVAQKHIQEHIKFLDTRAPSIEVGCLYANTPDKTFLIDKHPEHKNVILVTGFSGTGFKFGVGVGEIVSDLIDNQPPKINLASFSALRKISQPKPKL